MFAPLKEYFYRSFYRKLDSLGPGHVVAFEVVTVLDPPIGRAFRGSAVQRIQQLSGCRVHIERTAKEADGCGRFEQMQRYSTANNMAMGCIGSSNHRSFQKPAVLPGFPEVF